MFFPVDPDERAPFPVNGARFCVQSGKTREMAVCGVKALRMGKGADFEISGR
jgi:hypothetical protein